MGNKMLILEIAKPCSQGWNNMEAANGGRFCSSCSKVVIDFTRMENEQVIEFFKKRPENVCGHFRKSQLETNYTFTYKKAPWTFNATFLRLSLAGILTFSSVKGFSQNVKNQQTTFTQDNSGKKKVVQNITVNSKGETKLKIRLKDGNSGKQIYSGFVQITETNKSFKCLKSGFVSLSVPDSLNGKIINLVISSDGYENEFLAVDLKKQAGAPIIISMYKWESRVDGGIGYRIIEKSSILTDQK